MTAKQGWTIPVTPEQIAEARVRHVEVDLLSAGVTTNTTTIARAIVAATGRAA